MIQIIDETAQDLRALVEADFGPLAPGASMADAVRDWLHFKARTVPMRPRRVIVAPEAEAFRSAHPTITTLEKKLRASEDVRPWLSNSARNRQDDPHADMLFNDWQILHFHLSDNFKAPDCVERTDPLLFTFMGASHAVFLTVKPHKGSFALQEYLRILLRTSPKDMEISEINNIKGVPRVHTDDELFNLRKNGMNAAIEMDGRYFMPPGQGVVATKHASRLTRFRDNLNEMIKETKRAVQQGAYAKLQLIPPMTVIQVRLGLRIAAGVLSTYDKLRSVDFYNMQPLE
jgi:hypothetical protein